MTDRVYCECCDREIEGDVDECPSCQSRRIRKPERCRCDICEAMWVAGEVPIHEPTL